MVVCVINHTLLFPGEDDLVDVVEEVIDVASRWRSLGLVLRLKVAELDTISSKNHTIPTECLNDMLLAWLLQRYDTKKFGPPSWRMLCQAISKLLEEITQHWQGRLQNTTTMVWEYQIIIKKAKSMTKMIMTIA